MEFFNSAIDTLQTLVVALGGALCVWGGINLLEGYGQDNPGAKSHGRRSSLTVNFTARRGRMLEIYLVTSVAPIPMSMMMNRESSHIGQNYLKSLGALGLQAFLIIICVAIYAALVHTISVTSDISAALWTCMGYTVLPCFSLFKTGSLAKSIIGAH